jgi:O-antigen/teichoic acid export membrane protein
MTPLSDQRSASGETVRRMFDDVAALGRNYALSLGGEALQSGFHFILNLLLIRALPAYDYGVFAIVFILGGISITYGNALVSIPANIRIARLRSARAVAFLDVAFGSVALAICLGVAVIVASGLWLTTDRPGESLAGGAFVGIWTLRNHVRSTMFARQRASTVTLSDGFYTATGAALVAGLLGLRSQVPQATMILLFLTAANAVAIAAALAMPRRPIRISFRRGVRRSYRAIFGEIGWSLIWVTTWNIQGQGLMFMVAAIVGPAAYAPIAAGIVLFGPLRTGVGAFINVVRPEFARGLAEERYRQVKLTLFGSFAVIAWVCVAYGAAVWMGWPLLAQYVYGAKFARLDAADGALGVAHRARRHVLPRAAGAGSGRARLQGGCDFDHHRRAGRNGVDRPADRLFDGRLVAGRRCRRGGRRADLYLRRGLACSQPTAPDRPRRGRAACRCA